MRTGCDLQPTDSFINVLLEACRIGVVAQPVMTNIGGDGESGGNRHSERGHLCEARSFSSEDQAHGAVALNRIFAESIYPFDC
jgi:hypothetical protein